MIPGAGDTRPKTIQGLVNQTRSIDAGGSYGSSTLWLPGFADGGNPGWSFQTQAPRFWVLNRADPAHQPSSFVASDSSTVPPGLEQVLDNQHILVAAVLASTPRVPQGPLYHLLSVNGAGTALAAVESLNTGMACGVLSMFSYVLVSVAGPEEELGIEFLDLPAPLTDFNPVLNGLIGASLSAFDLVLDDNNGLYYPSPSVFPVPPS